MTGRVAKTAFAAHVPYEAFAADRRTAAAVAYLTANLGRRSLFTNSSQPRAFDAVAERLLERCEGAPAEGWLALAHVFPRADVLARVPEADRLQLLGLALGALREAANLLQVLLAAQSWRLLGPGHQLRQAGGPAEDRDGGPVIDTAPERPTVRDGELRLPDGQRLALDTREWDAWLAQALSFDVAHPEGDFLVAREKRGRGGLYWVARRYDRGRWASAYIGARVTAADLEKAAAELAGKIDGQAPAERKAPPGRRVLSTPQLDAIAGESDPTTMRAVVVITRWRRSDYSARSVCRWLATRPIDKAGMLTMQHTCSPSCAVCVLATPLVAAAVFIHGAAATMAVSQAPSHWWNTRC